MIWCNCDRFVWYEGGSRKFRRLKASCLCSDRDRYDGGGSCEIWKRREAGCFESSLSESAGDTFVQTKSSDAFLIKNLAVGGDVRIPRALGSVSFADPRIERYVNGRMVRVAEARSTSGLRYASLIALRQSDQDFSNGRA